ncbi:lipoyl(octanoyl) transferase LipB [Buchnera aphidicola (Hyadaphis tataricae)]|uniref:Octanoyltransferase n=1 Tax=Buchnera aphidicola (Hyadaphis tataricae) TaxID=1241859 RepID=A0A4D6Y6K4_9GAMM|nr:lipoyl(octanoyl) transferase LipB [Buchnera aphidicola]QCI21570.1 lipoyl(octanoyl) transferase LipB [Buchnera aphidicola (Hyadaphis tataricae)]
MYVVVNNTNIIFRNLGLEDYSIIFKKMHDFCLLRNSDTSDEIWFVEHYPTFTKGLSNQEKKITHIHNIPVINTNRGGNITYHAPGQQILYFLIDLKRRNINIRQLITIMENIVIKTLNQFSIPGYLKAQSPGIYVNEKKICSLGLRVTKHSTLHGLAINVNMDLTPFNYIHPCGDKNIIMTQIKDFHIDIKLKNVRNLLMKISRDYFKY